METVRKSGRVPYALLLISKLSQEADLSDEPLELLTTWIGFMPQSFFPWTICSSRKPSMSVLIWTQMGKWSDI